MPFNTGSSVTMEQTLRILNYTRSLYPAIILGIFVVSFIIFGVVNSPDDSDKVKVESSRGPGGRPLPTRRKSANQIKEAVATKDFSPRAKAAFATLTSGLILAFVANGVSILIRVVTYQEDNWWPGQSAVVCLKNAARYTYIIANLIRCSLSAPSSFGVLSSSL